MSNYDGIRSHSQSQSNSSPNAKTINMDRLENQVSGDRLENVEHYVDDNIDKKLEGEDEEEDLLGDSKKIKKRVVTSRSPWWEHFIKFHCEKDNVQKARCKYCSREIKADPKAHGTRLLKNHYESCKKKPQEITRNQNRLSFQPTRMGDRDAPLVNWRFKQDKTREALCHMLIMDELPFKLVEHPGFRHFLSVACPMFAIPSRRTITKDIFNIYVHERARLKSFMKDHAQRMELHLLDVGDAISLKIAFDTYEDVDLAYKTDLSRQPFDGIPTDHDWKRAKVLVKFLKHFYSLTLRISGALYVTSNLVFVKYVKLT
ncbi:UNVERIFIED_CONTAM: hypothetical protein Sindi_0979500 [Sesamum indicum]